MAESNEYVLTVKIDGSGGGGGSKSKLPGEEEGQKSFSERSKEWLKEHVTPQKIQQVAASGFALGTTIASKAAGYSGNYIKQTRIRESVAAIGMTVAIGMSVKSLMTGNVFGGVMGLLATGAAVGMSIWDYHENIKQQNLQAAYQATYSGARMNQGKL